MEYLKRTWADISLDNLSHNYHALRAKIPSGCRFLGVVKADAYGHGAVPVSRYLTELGAEYLAVSNIEEAVQLRRGGIRGPILILGYTPVTHAEDLAKMGLRQEIHSLDYAEQLNRRLEGTSLRIRVHIKLDTGMSRLGFFAYNCERTVSELQQVAAMKHLLIEGVFTHFPVADSIDGADANFTRTQFERFMDMLTTLKGVGIEPQIRHCCNSGASILYPEYALDMIRPGIATYGVLPSADLRGMIDLRPVMQLRSTIFRSAILNRTSPSATAGPTRPPIPNASPWSASAMPTVCPAAFRATSPSCCTANVCRRSDASAWICAWWTSRASRRRRSATP